MAEKFYLVRHGETVANAESWAAGHMDTHLTDRGREQACAARSKLESLAVRPEFIIHSQLIRTIETANILNADLNLPMQTNPAFAEQFYGDWQGKDWQMVSENLHAGIDPPNGETRADFVARVQAGFAAVAQLSKPALVVTHGGVIKVLGYYYGVDLGYVTNCEICEVIPDQNQIRVI